jgi:3-oxoadipate enol-lactonase
MFHAKMVFIKLNQPSQEQGGDDNGRRRRSHARACIERDRQGEMAAQPLPAHANHIPTGYKPMPQRTHPMTAISTVHIGPAPRIAVDHGGSGPLVVFLHGIGGHRTNWRDQLAAAAPHFHAVAWDARGYGESDDYEGPLDFADFSRDLARVIDHFGAGAAHLVGLSMGGMIIQDFYRRHPERVLSLVLADTRNQFQRANGEEFLKLREAPLLAGLTPRDIAPKVAASLSGPRTSAEARARLEESVSLLHTDSYLKTLRATTLIAQREEFKGMAAFVEPKSIKVPTLVICGADDTVTPPEMSDYMVDNIPGARLSMIPDAGHLSNIEKPAEFNQAMMDFLLQCKARRA